MQAIHRARAVRILAVAPRFALIYLTAVCLLTAAVFLSIRLDERGRLDHTLTDEKGDIQTAELLLTERIAGAASDMRFLARLPAVRAYLNAPQPDRRDQVANVFLPFAEESKQYSQIRLLDAGGQEIVRVGWTNGKTRIVPVAELQNKSGRDYFRRAIALSSGKVYVSPFDLNVEHDKIEIPYRPTVRVAAPLFDDAGIKRGVIVLNYSGSDLLRHFQAVKNNDDMAAFMLLNHDGYWLSGPRHEDEWGFMLGKTDRTFGHDFPEAWRTIENTERGSLRTDQGLFVYDTFYPDRAAQASASDTVRPMRSDRGTSMADEYQWKIVSRVSNSEVLTAGRDKAAAAILLGAAYVLLALGAWLLAYFNVSRQRARADLAENEARLREITDTMGEGLIVTDASGIISLANRRASDLTGYADHELRGADLHQLLHVRIDGTPSPRGECRIIEMLQTGKAGGSIEETFRKKDGTVLPVDTNISAIVRDKVPSGAVCTFRDVTLVKVLQAKLREQASLDPVTGLFNRRYLDEVLDRELARAQREGHPLSIVMGDIDHFKAVNDNYGHQCGDLVLQTFAALMKRGSRRGDFACRYGGEEFLLVLTDTPLDVAHERTEQLRLALEQSVTSYATSAVKVTATFGIASFPANGTNVQALFAAADAALYAAKNGGRNQVCDAISASAVHDDTDRHGDAKNHMADPSPVA